MFKSSCHTGSKYSGGNDKNWNDDYGKHCGTEYKQTEWDDKYGHCWDDKRYDDNWDDKSYDDKSCHQQDYKHCNDDYSHSSSSYGHH